MNFREYAENFVYRIDKDRVADFSKGLRTYYHAPDWSSSGTFDDLSEIPPDWKQMTGLFAGQLKHVIPYAVPRDVKWIVMHDEPRPTVIFAQADKSRIANNRPYLSSFPVAGFQQMPSGEFFSIDPKQASRQDVIRNPLAFMRQWYNVKFVPDLIALAKQLRSQNIQFDAEGL